MDTLSKEANMVLDIEELYKEVRQASIVFEEKHGEEVAKYRQIISEEISNALNKLKKEASNISDNNQVVNMLTEQIVEYVDWLQWVFWDLPYFAVALNTPVKRLRSTIVGCGFVYLSMRIVDDVLDRHYWYKGRKPTLLSAVTKTTNTGHPAEALTVLSALLVCFEGLLSLGENNSNGEYKSVLEQNIKSIKSTILGAIMEFTSPSDWTDKYYDRMIKLKNVEYSRSLYVALESNKDSGLYKLIEEYYSLAQILNDIQDYPEDLQRQQPNIITIYNQTQKNKTSKEQKRFGKLGYVPKKVTDLVIDKFMSLSKIANSLNGEQKSVAQLKIYESIKAANDLGVFTVVENVIAKDDKEYTGLAYHSELEDVIRIVGDDVFEECNCSVCNSNDREFIFRKQGHAYYKCTECSHIYITPRIISEFQKRLSDELDGEVHDDGFMEIQKVYATFLCEYIHKNADGQRVLDIGFGRGYLMQLLPAYGFEVYGIDSSKYNVEKLRPQFGERICQATLGIDKIEWDSFDVIVMSHVLEHIADPLAILNDIRQLLNPSGLLYIAVPDMDSVQFKVFGKHLEIINPLVHLQYFNNSSLTKLLNSAGFVSIENVESPAIPDEFSAKWMKLFNKLGGTDSGELAMSARNL